jgi:hypothetical protein
MDSLAATVAVLGAFLVMAGAYQAFVLIIVKSIAERIVTGEERDSMFFLYFKVMEEIDEEIHQMGLHPGRGHAAFGFRAPNNPLPKLNVCHFYKMNPSMFQTLCGLSPDEFTVLLNLVSFQMLKPRNGFCTFTDAEQAARKPQVNTLPLCLSLSPSPSPSYFFPS